MSKQTPFQLISKVLKEKSSMKQDIHDTTLEIFKLFKKELITISQKLNKEVNEIDSRLKVEFKDSGLYTAEIKFAGDILVFYMHTNIFKFDNNNPIAKTSYAKENENRLYCGMISVYNFLADSLKYNRINDLGYMIARIFINNEKHYFVEGKRQLSFLYNKFETEIIKPESMRAIIESAILYTIEFDLLTPPYSQQQEVTVNELQETTRNMMIKTGKRMGFTFQADTDQIDIKS